MNRATSVAAASSACAAVVAADTYRVKRSKGVTLAVKKARKKAKARAAAYDAAKARANLPLSAITVMDHITLYYDGNQAAFARDYGVFQQIVGAWCAKGFIIVGDVVYSPKRTLKKCK